METPSHDMAFGFCFILSFFLHSRALGLISLDG